MTTRTTRTLLLALALAACDDETAAPLNDTPTIYANITRVLNASTTLATGDGGTKFHSTRAETRPSSLPSGPSASGPHFSRTWGIPSDDGTTYWSDGITTTDPSLDVRPTFLVVRRIRGALTQLVSAGTGAQCKALRATLSATGAIGASTHLEAECVPVPTGRTP